jgi:flavin reductase (DIM6/NTAB) family NADH-FMN oxidoreductase RutF
MSSEGVESRMAPVSSEEFRRACSRFATGVTIASVVDREGAPCGLTVSSFTSVSLEPPLVLICLGHAVTNIEDFRHARHFGISILREREASTASRFAQKGHDRFEGVDWLRGETGVPLLANALAVIECAVYQRIPSGDHDIFVGEVVRTCVNEGAPLLHFAGRYGRLTQD